MTEDCKIPGCKRNVELKKWGICRAHYNRVHKTGDHGVADIRKRTPMKPFVIKPSKKA
jgi:hypothetical protein